jgi:RNA polymerase sigma factor (sigma-70 family)
MSQPSIASHTVTVKGERRKVDDVGMDRSGRRVSRGIGEGFDSVLAAAQSGAPWALERLYQSLASPVAGYLRVQGAADHDDLTNEVLYRALTGVGSFAGDEAQFRSWVFTIAHNRLVDERRSRARRPVAADSEVEQMAAPGGDVEDDALRRLGTERVRRLCDQLAPDQRDVLLLRMAAGMSLEETAEALGKSVGAVKALQHRAVAALRRHFLHEGVSR